MVPLSSPQGTKRDCMQIKYPGSLKDRVKDGGYIWVLAENRDFKDWTVIQYMGISARCKMAYAIFLTNLEEPSYQEGVEQLTAKVCIALESVQEGHEIWEIEMKEASIYRIWKSGEI